MRLGKFESFKQTPLGQGDEKKVFIDPSNEKRVISERIKETEEDSHRQLKGRYYLTKIIHTLLPKNIPDIYQAGESSNGTQTTDRERIAHSKGHALLQKLRKSGKNEDEAGKAINEEMGSEISKITSKLEELGLGFNIQENLGNYSKDETGNVYYLETFDPWQEDSTISEGLEMLFDKDLLVNAIEKITDESAKKQCEGYLKRLLELASEEEQEIKKSNETKSGGPEIDELKAMFISFELKYSLEILNAITTKEEALASEKRKGAKEALATMLTQLNSLLRENKITHEQYLVFNEKRREFSNAVGIITATGVDHDRKY